MSGLRRWGGELWCDHEEIMTKQKQDEILYKALEDLKATANNFAIRFINDDSARIKYNKVVKQMTEEVLLEYNSGRITALQGAEKAQTARNIIMDQIRKITSDIGKAEAVKMKSKGKTLYELENYKAYKLYNRPFEALTTTEKNRVWLDIVRSQPDSKFNLKVRKLGRVGRLLVVLTLAVAVYNITTADDKATAAEREAVTVGGGFLGGAAGGAVAGLACGPGAPVCSTIGVFIGGILGAIGSDFLYDFFSSKTETSTSRYAELSPAFENYQRN